MHYSPQLLDAYREAQQMAERGDIHILQKKLQSVFNMHSINNELLEDFSNTLDLAYRRFIPIAMYRAEKAAHRGDYFTMLSHITQAQACHGAISEHHDRESRKLDKILQEGMEIMNCDLVPSLMSNALEARKAGDLYKEQWNLDRAAEYAIGRTKRHMPPPPHPKNL